MEDKDNKKMQFEAHEYHRKPDTKNCYCLKARVGLEEYKEKTGVYELIINYCSRIRILCQFDTEY